MRRPKDWRDMQTPPLRHTASPACLEPLRIDLRVDTKAIEGRFLGGGRTPRATDAERKLHSVHVAIVGVVRAVLERAARGRDDRAGVLRIGDRQRQMECDEGRYHGHCTPHWFTPA